MSMRDLRHRQTCSRVVGKELMHLRDWIQWWWQRSRMRGTTHNGFHKDTQSCVTWTASLKQSSLLRAMHVCYCPVIRTGGGNRFSRRKSHGSASSLSSQYEFSIPVANSYLCAVTYPPRAVRDVNLPWARSVRSRKREVSVYKRGCMKDYRSHVQQDHPLGVSSTMIHYCGRAYASWIFATNRSESWKRSNIITISLKGFHIFGPVFEALPRT